MPTVPAIKAAMGMSPEELELPENLEKKKLLIWYYDRYLPAAARKEYWGDDVRYYKLYTDKINLKGKQKVAVTITSEAFGLLQLRNCGKKWENIFILKAQNEKAEIPTKNTNPESVKYRAEWTDPKIGQVKYGGWNPKAIEFMNNTVAFLAKHREDDAANNNEKAEYYKEILREENEIKSDAPGRKRKKKKSLDETPAPAPAPITKIRRIEE